MAAAKKPMEAIQNLVEAMQNLVEAAQNSVEAAKTPNVVIPTATSTTSIPLGAQEKPGRRSTYASFGKDGVTATVNTHGHLLQITRYFGNKPSGFFCVDLDGISDPHCVIQRMEDLQSCISNPHKGMRLRVEESAAEEEEEAKDDIPTMSFLHNRWPKFIKQIPPFNLEVQYFVSQNTVYQTYIFTSDGKSSTSSNFPLMLINTELLIRDLNFVEGSTWNTRELSHDSYSLSVPEGMHCIIRMHKTETGQDIKNSEIGQNDDDAVALAIWPFIDGRRQKVRLSGAGPNYMITPDIEATADFSKNKQMTVTLAYTLTLANSSAPECISPPASPMEFLKELKESQTILTRPLFSGDSHLDFTLKRNLEHILSVCSIPVGDDSDGEIQPIVLTCGDMAGHRVANEASFAAFRFLLLAFQHFGNTEFDADHSCGVQNSSCGIFDCQMRSRIWRICQGHLKWITNKMEITEGGHSHHWASGQQINDGADSPLLPKRSLMDIPFHIIKAAEFRPIAGDEEAHNELREQLKSIVKIWVKTLDNRNKHGVYAFPRPREEVPMHSFYFPDHAIIWWAAKSAEDLGLSQELDINESACSTHTGRLKMSYSSDEIRTNIIKRFTTENPVSKKRMIAISRSPSETRFLLRMKDTALFSVMDLGLFNESAAPLRSSVWENKVSVWTNTVDCQPQHEDNLDAQWNHPLQFALAIIMSSNGKCINLKPADEMFDRSKLILLESSSPNGLFPGQLGEDKEPTTFNEEIMSDSYWHATFEVPYILWKYQKTSSLTEGTEPAGSLNISDTTALAQARTTRQAVGLTFDDFSQGLENMIDRLSGVTSVSRLPTVNGKLAIKKSVPFRNLIDQNDIVELSDEWMYTEPRFFKHKYCLSEHELLEKVGRENLNGAGAVITDAVKMISTPKEKKDNPKDYLKGYIINIPRDNHEKELAESLPKSNSDVCDNISRERTPEKAKKKLFHFFQANSTTAIICYLASSERPETSSFFDRHAAYDKYFFDDVTPEINKWVTEFHLSFYQILDSGSSSKVIGIPQLEEIEYPHPNNTDVRRISRAVMSFRFDGDFFDRYWTCNVFDFNPKLMIKSDKAWKSLKVTEKKLNGISKAQPWKQRRILELILVDNMLQEILYCSREILEEIKKSVQNSAKQANGSSHSQKATAPGLLDTLDLFMKVNNEKYITTSHLWHKFQHILQVVENDLGENLVKMILWMDREKERGQERPRWTRNDERDYRPLISKLKAANDHKFHELQRCYVNITSFNASLSRNLDIMRSDLELRGADDIRLFTYVTVAFLPVSFATGVFSMSAAPSRQTLISMIITAGVALLVTLIALASARVLELNIVGPILRKSHRSAVLVIRVVRQLLYSVVEQLLYPVVGAVGQLLQILFFPFVYVLARYLIIPLIDRSKHSNSEVEAPQPASIRKLFDDVGPLSLWEKARKDYQNGKQKKKKRGGTKWRKDGGEEQV